MRAASLVDNPAAGPLLMARRRAVVRATTCDWRGAYDNGWQYEMYVKNATTRTTG